MVKLKKIFPKGLNKLHLLVAVAVILITAGLVYATIDNNSAQTPPPDTSKPNSNAGQTINLDPPTAEEKKAAEDYKKSLTQPPTPVTPSGKKKVYPVITNANHSEVRAYVSGIIEDGGTCTATATQGSKIVTASSAGFANVSYTSCTPIPISLPVGPWSVVVSYSSAAAEGKSQPYGVN